MHRIHFIFVINPNSSISISSSMPKPTYGGTWKVCQSMPIAGLSRPLARMGHTLSMVAGIIPRILVIAGTGVASQAQATTVQPAPDRVPPLLYNPTATTLEDRRPFSNIQIQTRPHKTLWQALFESAIVCSQSLPFQLALGSTIVYRNKTIHLLELPFSPTASHPPSPVRRTRTNPPRD